MTTLNRYIDYNTQPKPQANYEVTVTAIIPTAFREKVETVVKYRGYSSFQEYLNILFKEVDLKEVIIPYEVLALIEEDFTTLKRVP